MSRRFFAADARVIVAVVPLACAACQHVPPAPIDAAKNAERIAARSLTGAALHDDLARHGLAVAPNGAWSLDQLTFAAWTLRTDLAVARSEFAAARAAAAVAGRRPNPTVTTTTERVVDSGTAAPWVLGAAVGLTLETGGKREIRRQRAAAEQQALEWQFGEALWSARAEVRAALLDLAFAREAVALDEDESRFTRAFLAWVDMRLAHGAATTPERLAAVQAANESDSRRSLDAAALAGAAATLAAAVGVAPAEIERARPQAPDLAALPTLSEADVGQARDAALVNRLDVRRALADYDAAEQGLRAAVAAQYPDITLAPGYLHDQSDHKITFGLDLPLLLRGKTSAAIAQAIAERAVAAARFDDVQAAALAAVDVGLAQYRAARDALAAAEQAEADASAAVAAAERALAAGAVSRGELLSAEIARVGLRRSAFTARRAAIDSVTAIENGLERPLFPPSSLEPAGAIGELLVRQP
jgi:outer membrane protein TolC